MLTEIALLGIVLGAVVGLFEASSRPVNPRLDDATAEAAIRAALDGPDRAAVAAEFRRRGVIAPRPDSRRAYGIPVLPL
jgi:hypothetical protein